VTLDGDPGLFTEPQLVEAASGGERASARVRPNELQTLSIPLVPEDEVCTVRFEVSPTKMPPGDPRELGTHFRAFDYEEP
jgi:hypothetical protein